MLSCVTHDCVCACVLCLVCLSCPYAFMCLVLSSCDLYVCLLSLVSCMYACCLAVCLLSAACLLSCPYAFMCLVMSSCVTHDCACACIVCLLVFAPPPCTRNSNTNCNVFWHVPIKKTKQKTKLCISAPQLISSLPERLLSIVMSVHALLLLLSTPADFIPAWKTSSLFL